jgi:hypothetical protein
MARYLGWVTAGGALLLALARLGRLIQPADGDPGWIVPVGAAAMLGAAANWLVVGRRVRWVVTVNSIGVGFVLLRLAAGSTLRGGILPTAATWRVLGGELGLAWDTIRFGAAPVLPVPGLVGLLGVVFWGLGSCVAWGLASRRLWLAFLPSLALYLELATLDRRPPGPVWPAAMALVTVAGLAAWADSRQGGGRLRDSAGRYRPRRSTVPGIVVAAVMVLSAVFGTRAVASWVPEAGTIDWRSRTGLGSGLYGGTSFNLFVGLQQSLLDLSDEPMFFARVSGGVPNRELYWRLITLDFFDGINWVPGNQSFSPRGERWERPDWRFRGESVPVSARVRIAGLREQLLPTLYSPVDLRSDVSLIQDSFRVREDGSIGLDVRTQEGWEYEITAQVPRVDVARLATIGGELSPIFREAAEASVFTGRPVRSEFEPRPDDMDRWLELPEGLPPDLGLLAREVTAPGITRFEKAVLLEAWFRDPANFRYSLDVSTGHDALDLTAWLTDPESPNYRTGYCEQFATAMAAMARTLGIPSRVVLGFTPGEVIRQPDSSEVVVVRERNAHAWVELWMDNHGWIRFDPTPRSDGANPSLVGSAVGFDPRLFLPAPSDPAGLLAGDDVPVELRELGPEIDLEAGDPTPALFVPGTDSDLGRAAWVVILLLAGLGSLPAVKAWRRWARLRRLRRGDISAAWAEIVDRLGDLGEPLHAHLTPLELARHVDPEMVPLAARYSAAVYGDRAEPDGVGVFTRAEGVLARRYSRTARLAAWFSLRSLRR